MNLQELADQVNAYALENYDKNFLAYAEGNQLVIFTTYRKNPYDPAVEKVEKVTKFSDELLTQYKKETGPEFIKVLWGRTWNFSWNIDSKGNVVDTKHKF